jgi:acyl-CoA thioester hydrolase
MGIETKRMDKDGFAIVHPLRVRWSECDMHGIVFNVNYFLYYDIAMYEWQRAIGRDIDGQPDFITVHAECDFLRSALFDDQLDIAVRCAAIGTKSINLEAAIFRGAELLNRGKLTYVQVIKGSTDTAPLSPELIDRIVTFEKIAPLRALKEAGRS